MKTPIVTSILTAAAFSATLSTPASAAGFAPWNDRGAAIESATTPAAGYRSGDSFSGFAPWMVSTGGRLDFTRAQRELPLQEVAAGMVRPIGFSPWSS